ncbi:zinc-dependent alcohol dehydrogenase family protein [Herbaspirillum sp. RV1423]|uniref:zinc-dependent alcohol dehydrogenase family protein n=1 Tax=Herbaspirillum sp. RV1423 TaxID=1443993 RepID=UPI0005554D81|nr:zinc-dependent alcohol dehydrogenase family protein [Herbaspirillum sp. RV1423]
MTAMVLNAAGEALQLRSVEKPVAQANDLLIKVHACGVCRTDLHLVDAELPNAVFPVIPGHEIVGTIVATGSAVQRFRIGDRVGVPWLGHTCGHCPYCVGGRENLCDHPSFTGCTINGGYAEYVAADSQYCFPIPDNYSDLEAAPLLCAGLIGYRALRMAGQAQRIGVYGFGAAAQIITQIACHQGRTVYGFTRPGDSAAQRLAYDCGVAWAGSSDEAPPSPLDAALLFAPAGELVPQALRHVHKGGIVICAGIHMSDIPTFPYSLLWGERSICSVANLTRQDGQDFFALLSEVPLHMHIVPYPLKEANQALSDLRSGALKGTAVLQIS